LQVEAVVENNLVAVVVPVDIELEVHFL